MKRFNFTLLTALFLCILSAPYSLAQVTIGSKEAPNAGSLLDLKQFTPDASNVTATKGLLLPRVLLSTAQSLAPLAEDASVSDPKEYTGILVYHIGNVNLCAGTYTWNGGKWDRIPGQCVVSISCGSATINGTYEVGTPLTPANNNTITLKISVPRNVAGGTYNIYTDTKNGISFSATGVLAAGDMTITLQGTGTPLSGGRVTQFTIYPEFSNSEASPSTCSVTMASNTIPIARAGIFGFGNTAGTYGYHLESSASRAMMLTATNFGPNANSTVYSSGVTFTNPLTITDLTVPAFVNSAAFQSNPDIMINGFQSYTASNAVIDALVEYLEKGGVLIMLDEYVDPLYHITLRLLKRLCPDQASGISRITLGGPGSSYAMTSTIEDEITNGPFGDVRGTRWGEDASDTRGITGLPLDSITVYSTGNYISPSGTISNNPMAVTMFKHKRLNLFYVGDGGFNSNQSNFIGNNFGSTTICPMATDAAKKPIPRIGWGSGGAYTVHNSVIFANVMAWAVKNAPSNNRK